ncbi:MAG: aspartate ammonia-lyase [Proteobacteria bacterium]|nr:aspartate ammonia-lyase [Pseudomonadota bacterium]
MNTPKRIEKDFLGEMAIPDSCYYGIQTLRAVDNFQITGIAISSTPEMVSALASVKKAACLANWDLGVLDKEVTQAIIGACDEILAGKLHDQFVVDIIQGGAGTSTNMNANEVIANRALEILGHKKGEYQTIHPNNHVNCSQSTNDVYPTAFRLALFSLLTKLAEQARILQEGFAAKGVEFSDVIKMGRTQLQDAVPMTLGQGFAAYATTIGEDIDRILEARNLLCEINLGATAIGTAINTPKGYAHAAVEHLCRLTGIDFVLSPNLIEATWDTGAYVQISGVLKRYAIKLSKICNDLRLLSSGPRAGFNEINLPKMQPGSSIMPGKVNPVIPEMVNQVAYLVVGADVTISMASENGQLELNVMEPVIAHCLFTSIDRIGRASLALADKCVAGITANREHCRRMVENSIGIVTALNPILGYETCCRIAKQALQSDRSVYDLILEEQLMNKNDLDRALSIDNMIHKNVSPTGAYLG